MGRCRATRYIVMAYIVMAYIVMARRLDGPQQGYPVWAIDMHVGMRVDIGMCVAVYIVMRIDTCRAMCIDMCIDMRRDLCLDTCVD